jgi:hypothetical protein
MIATGQGRPREERRTSTDAPKPFAEGVAGPTLPAVPSP